MWPYGSWIYNFLCNQSLSPQTLWVQIPFRRGVLDTRLCDKICQWLASGRWFSPGTPLSSSNKTDRHEITEILLNTIKQTKAIIPSNVQSMFRAIRQNNKEFVHGKTLSLAVSFVFVCLLFLGLICLFCFVLFLFSFHVSFLLFLICSLWVNDIKGE